MKNFIYIGILFLAVALASCSKDAFKIQSEEERNIPAWEYGTKGVTDENGNPIDPNIADDDADEGGITDPNNDPDGRKKKP